MPYARTGSFDFEDTIFEEDVTFQRVVAPKFYRKNDSQDWNRIRARCLEEDVLWEDPVFKADNSSLYFETVALPQPPPVEWKRPKDIVDAPSFTVEGVSRFDINQGKLGDCWFLASLVNLTLHPHLFHRVVPQDQGFTEDYAGVFHFRFWQYGRWVDVSVDDRLPTRDNKLIYLYSSEKDEFWSPLLEKAYAKLHGSYEALGGGSMGEAMEAFTGGLSETFFLNDPPKNFFNMLLKSFIKGSLIGCCIMADPEITEERLPNGLVKGHAFSITCVQTVHWESPLGEVNLLRLRNPWGGKVEWNGPWSDEYGSEEWNSISEDQRQELGLTFDDDGEFWISFEDLLRNFTAVEVCSLSPDALLEKDDSVNTSWKTNMFEGSWVKEICAGGCRNFLDTFARNPQYRLSLTDVDEDNKEDLCSVIIGLMQKNLRSRKNKDPLSIGFYIYKLKDSEKLRPPLDRHFFESHKSIARVPAFSKSYEVCQRFLLPPGDYLVVPCTFLPHMEGEYLLRIFTEHPSQAVENDVQINLDNMYEKVQPPPATHEDEQRERRGKEIFKKIAGKDLEVDWKELKEILDHTMCDDVLCKGSFSKDDCRSMIAMMDVDRSGKLGFEEFKHLLVDIRKWKNIYQLHAQSKDSHLSVAGLQDALASAGYTLNQRILSMLAHRYADKAGKITFDDFIACAVKLKTMIEYFKDKDPSGSNQAEFSLSEWIIATLYS